MANRNALRHGLRAGKLPVKCQYIEHRINALRRQLEDAVIAVRTEIGIVDAANINEYDGHQVLNLRARYQVTDNLEITGRIMNLGNVEFAERADFAFGSFRYFPGEPRTAYIGTSVSF